MTLNYLFKKKLYDNRFIFINYYTRIFYCSCLCDDSTLICLFFYLHTSVCVCVYFPKQTKWGFNALKIYCFVTKYVHDCWKCKCWTLIWSRHWQWNFSSIFRIIWLLNVIFSGKLCEVMHIYMYVSCQCFIELCRWFNNLRTKVILHNKILM